MNANKAVLAAVLAGLASLVAALTERNPVSFREWLLVVLSAIVAGLAVYVVPNRPKR
jgi:drug/metabolite transporter (DMT)-like permease